MKKTMLFAAMVAVALSSCNKNEMEGPDIQAGSQLAEIKVGQEVQGLQTKAAINEGDQVEALIIATGGDAPENWGSFVSVTENTFAEGAKWNAETFANTAVGTFTAGVNQVVGLSPVLYAKSEGEAGTLGATLTGVAPVGSLSNGKITFKVFDGLQDVMTANTTTKHNVNYNKGTYSIDPFHLEFKHRTAQLRFLFGAANTAGTGAWEETITVKNVTVKNTNVPSAVRLAKDTLYVDWTKVQNISLENFTVNELPQTYGTQKDGEIDIVTLDKAAMVKPGVNVVLDVTMVVGGVEKAFKDIKPTKVGGGNLTTLEGMYHNIHLTIKKPADPADTPSIEATATVTEWGKGDEGEAELK